MMDLIRMQKTTADEQERGSESMGCDSLESLEHPLRITHSVL
jgi:hypothetical protein